MIAKIVTGSNFRGVIHYMMNKGKGAEVLDSRGVRLKDMDSIISSFITQQKLNPKISKPVYHISLDFSIKDTDRLTNEKMKEIAREYLLRMGIKNTQYIAIRHYDKQHPHLHLCINRIDNNGNLISNRNDRYRSEKVCKVITREYGLYFSSGKEQVKRDRLKGADKIKYEIYDAIKIILKDCRSWAELTTRLQQQGIETKFKYKGNTNTVEGVSFSKDGIHFNGSKIDRQFSFSKINSVLQNNQFDQDMSGSLHTGIESVFIHHTNNISDAENTNRTKTNNNSSRNDSPVMGGGYGEDPNKKKRKRNF